MNKKENPGVSRRGAAMLLLFSLAVSVLLGFAMPVHAADGGRTTLRTLRVGFYPYTGYMATAADGSRSGYAYELLQDIAQHENVTFAYSCLDGNTQQAMQQLAAGQIDLIPVLRRTAERDEQFAFSAEPIGTVATMLTVKAGNRSIVAGDYDTFDGITVGMSRSGNGRNESFRAYAEEHGFRYTPVYYDTDEELSSALRNGEITAAASNRLRETKNEWIIDTFDEQSIYIAMRKDDTVTQQLVNDAISKINRNDPSWRTTLFNKYYTGSHTSSKIYLTDAEEDYVIACNDADTVFTVLVNPDRYPYSYMTPDGMPTGIMVDIFQKAAGRARLRYKFLKPADRSEYKAMLADGQADFVIDLTDDMSQAENYGYKLTDSYLSAEFSWVLLRRHNGGLNNVAVAYDFSPSALEMPGLSDTAHVEYLDSFDNCLAAVHAGTVDAYYTYTYQAERTVFDDTRNELRSMLSGEQRNFCIGVRQDYDVLLRTVLNKSIDSLTRAEISTITNAYINLGQQPFSLTRLAYQYPAIIVLTCLCVLVTAVCIALVIRAQRFRAETEKALRKAEEASVAKTEFLSNMSHDIRTPINGIMGMLDIAEDNFDNKARVRDCMTKMRGAASHLLSLINDVLDMTKIESGNMQMLDTSFDLRALLDSCCSIVEGQIVDRHMTFTKQIGPFWHPYLIGSELHIRQVLINILSNAVKYTPDGGEINFRAKETLFEEGLVHLRMEIKDNGIGMTPEFQKIMFEPFSRADDHRTTKVQGTGLGMAIARNIVNLMNGDIQVESAPNKGTKITVTVYLKLQENEKEQEKELLDLPVLVVDDDKTCCESTVATLQEIGIAGEWVLTGKEAVERCAARHKTGRDYFAVILDWKMPQMDGIATARRIRECVGEDVTIIILTSFDLSEIEEEARAAGVNAFMAKPLFRSRLTATLRQFTSGKKEKNARNYLEDFAKENYAGKRILLVEDNALNREIATEIIGMTGVTIDSAENGKIAVEKVMEAPEKWYDLIFMDIQMPIMNGFEATAAIRALADSRGKVPIIAMTANAFAEDVQLAKNTGMNEHIAKPLDLNKLNDVLKQWL
mgnify:CR=1 FL=1